VGLSTKDRMLKVRWDGEEHIGSTLKLENAEKRRDLRRVKQQEQGNLDKRV
jgi:hypothetical protein